jgi:hypothetical protein
MRISTRMELLHHQAFMREEDNMLVCSRCGMVNPSNDQPCIPVSSEPAIESVSDMPVNNDKA